MITKRRGEPLRHIQLNGRRKIVALISTASALVLLLALSAVAYLYVDLQWFRSIGLEEIFSTILWTRIGLGFAIGVLVFAAFYGSVRLALRLSRRGINMLIAPPAEQQRILGPPSALGRGEFTGIGGRSGCMPA